MAGSRGGRPHKGDRVLVQTRPHRQVVERLDNEAAGLGITRSEYVALVLSKALDMEQFAPALPRQNGQEVLPLGRTA